MERETNILLGGYDGSVGFTLYHQGIDGLICSSVAPLAATSESSCLSPVESVP